MSKVWILTFFQMDPQPSIVDLSIPWLDTNKLLLSFGLHWLPKYLLYQRYNLCFLELVLELCNWNALWIGGLFHYSLHTWMESDPHFYCRWKFLLHFQDKLVGLHWLLVYSSKKINTIWTQNEISLCSSMLFVRERPNSTNKIVLTFWFVLSTFHNVQRQDMGIMSPNV